MLTLIGFPGCDGLRSYSPFSYKAEALIALARRPYRVEYIADFSSLPNGKVPVLKDGDLVIPDSALIQRHLEHAHGLSIDRCLSTEERAIGQAFGRMAEEHLYWAMIHARWINPAGEAMMLGAVFGAMPEDQRKPAFEGMREHIGQELNVQGLGRHQPEDIYGFGCADIDAIATHLNGKPFFFGEQVTSIDACLTALLANIIASDIDVPLMRHAQSIPELAEYVTRFEQRVFHQRLQAPS